tara:strand:+ start:2283 stop:3515 length:1233 start_codon:yes stop_codon:yes gene_type:complete
MDNNSHSNRIDNRLLDLYQNLINQTVDSYENMTTMYRETLDVLLQIENGLRLINDRNLNEQESQPNHFTSRNISNENNSSSPIRNQQRTNSRFQPSLVRREFYPRFSNQRNNNRQRNNQRENVNNQRENVNNQRENPDSWRRNSNRRVSLNNNYSQNNSNTQTPSTLDEFFRTFSDGNVATFQREFIFPLIPNDLQPVVVRPSQEQINLATESIQYDSNTMDTNICPITRETFSENEEIIKIKHCGHYFNKLALNNWFERSVLCPVCRYDIREYRNTEDISEESSQNSNSSRNISTRENTNNNYTPLRDREYNTFNHDPPYSFNNSSFPSPTNRNIANILDEFSDNVTNQFLNDISLNSNALNFRYRIETPNNSLTLSTLSPGGISNIFRNLTRIDSNGSSVNDNSNNYL